MPKDDKIRYETFKKLTDRAIQHLIVVANVVVVHGYFSKPYKMTSELVIPKSEKDSNFQPAAVPLVSCRIYLRSQRRSYWTVAETKWERSYPSLHNNFGSMPNLNTDCKLLRVTDVIRDCFSKNGTISAVFLNLSMEYVQFDIKALNSCWSVCDSVVQLWTSQSHTWGIGSLLLRSAVRGP